MGGGPALCVELWGWRAQGTLVTAKGEAKADGGLFSTERPSNPWEGRKRASCREVLRGFQRLSEGEEGAVQSLEPLPPGAGRGNGFPFHCPQTARAEERREEGEK